MAKFLPDLKVLDKMEHNRKRKAEEPRYRFIKLSPKAFVRAAYPHKDKDGYISVVRKLTYKSTGERKIHISSSAFKEVVANIDRLMHSLNSAEFTACKVYLTKAQIMMISVFEHSNERYLTISYENRDGLDLSRTINLSVTEATVFARHIGELKEIVNFEEADSLYMWSLLDSSVGYDGGKKEITAYMITNAGDGGFTDVSVYASQEDAKMSLEDHPLKDKLTPMRVAMQRPEKYAIVEAVIGEEVNKEIAKTNAEDKKSAFASMNKLRVSAIVCEAMRILCHDQPFHAIELVEAFVYCGGLDKIAQGATPDDVHELELKSLLMSTYHMALCRVEDY